MHGDVISISTNGVTVNNERLPLSQPLTSSIASLPRFYIAHYRLQPNEYLVLGEHPASLDSRYFGLVQRANIRSALHPILTWNSRL